MTRFIVVALLASCVSSSQIGPYVKSVQRNGAWLAVQKCMIILEGEHLNEGSCTLEHVPLGSLPMMPAPQPGPPVSAPPGAPQTNQMSPR